MSTADDPAGVCFTPFGSTFDWQMTFSPDGTSSFTCQGDILSGLPDTTVRFNSTPDDPVGVCRTPFDTTLDWQAIYSPSGKSSFVCQGELPY